MELLNKDLTFKKDIDFLCTVTGFIPRNNFRDQARYAVRIPYINQTINLTDEDIKILFDVLEKKEAKKPIPEKKEIVEEKVSDASDDRRKEISKMTKSQLLELAASEGLEDEITSSLKKEPLLEEILKHMDLS